MHGREGNATGAFLVVARAIRGQRQRIYALSQASVEAADTLGESGEQFLLIGIPYALTKPLGNTEDCQSIVTLARLRSPSSCARGKVLQRLGKVIGKPGQRGQLPIQKAPTSPVAWHHESTQYGPEQIPSNEGFGRYHRLIPFAPIAAER